MRRPNGERLPTCASKFTAQTTFRKILGAGERVSPADIGFPSRDLIPIFEDKQWCWVR
jgi:hypothetical protein